MQFRFVFNSHAFFYRFHRISSQGQNVFSDNCDDVVTWGFFVGVVVAAAATIISFCLADAATAAAVVAAATAAATTMRTGKMQIKTKNV